MAFISPQEALKGGKFRPVGTTTSIASPAKQGGGFFEDAWDDIKETGRDIVGAFRGAEEKIDQIDAAQERGEQGGFRSAFQRFGARTGAVSDAIGEAVIGAGKAVLPQGAEEAIASGTQAAIRPIVESEVVQDIVSRYQSLDEQTKRDIDSLIGVGKLALDVAGAGIAGKGAKVAGRAGATVAGEAVSRSAGVVETLGRGIEATGSTVYRSAITPTAKEAERILTFRAQAPFSQRVKSALTGSPIYDEAGRIVTAPITRGQTALEKGIVGSPGRIGVEARRQNQQLYKTTIEPALQSSDAVVTKDELFAPIVERINTTAEPGRKKALQEAFEAIQEEYANVTQYDLVTAQKVKQGLDEFTPEKVFRGKSIASEYRTLQNDMANAIRRKTYDSLADVNIRKAYIDYGNLKELEKVGVKAISESGTKGGFGGFWSTMWDVATIPVKTVGGQVLYRVGNKLQFLGKKGIKTFGQYLKSKGYSRPKL